MKSWKIWPTADCLEDTIMFYQNQPFSDGVSILIDMDIRIYFICKL